MIRHHLQVSKAWLIGQIRANGAKDLLKDWDGSDEDAIQAIADQPYEYFPIGDCTNRGANGECLGHDQCTELY